MYKKIVKPLIDRLLALIGLLVLFPLILLVTILLLVYNRGTPFFVQKRPGLNGRPFNLLKFKTMRDAFDEKGQPLPDEQRITVVGNKVRSWSLDEILQLWNVLIGDMSLVGPRPLLMSYLPLYSTLQARRHEVKPGITGLAQVNGRNAISWEDKFTYDVYYVDNVGPILDITIIFKTIIKVLKRSNVSSQASATMPMFTGSVKQTSMK